MKVAWYDRGPGISRPSMIERPHRPIIPYPTGRIIVTLFPGTSCQLPSFVPTGQSPSSPTFCRRSVLLPEIFSAFFATTAVSFFIDWLD